MRVRREWRWIGLSASGVVLFLAWYFWVPSRSADELLDQARLALERGKFDQAEALAAKALRTATPSPWAALVAAEAAARSHRPQAALDYYEQVPADAGEATLAAMFGAAEMHCHLGHLSEGDRRLRQVLERDPDHVLAHYRLAFVLNITGQRFDAIPHLLHLVRAGVATPEHLLLLGNTERMVEDQALLDQSRAAAPEDVLPLLGEARRCLALSQVDRARELFAQVLRTRSDLAEAQVRWGQILFDTGKIEEFLAWNHDLPRNVEQHPEVWVLRGRCAVQRGEPAVAARCFWEALRRDPANRAAHYQLGQILVDLRQAELASLFLQRAELLQQLAVVLDDLFHHRDQTELMRRAAAITELVGRYWEAHGWAMLAFSADQSLDWPQPVIGRLRPMLAADLPQVHPRENLARLVDLSRELLPPWSGSASTVAARDDGFHTPSAIRFEDVAASVGIDFRYFNNADLTTAGARILETTGGGVGVLDYDADGWPDLYFTQGCEKPAPSTSRSADVHRDQFFRNVGGQRFANVTADSGLGDADFSQGMTFGDFDNDGFADLYVANFGQNRLYCNQGDGTFRDVTDSAGLRAEQWTTSVLLADLNGDSLPDLYDVNYCAGADVETRICEKQGQTRSCSPRAFAAAADQVWLNLGDGRFRDVTASCGVGVPAGYGLGIVAADFADDGRLSLFIANDEVANFHFQNQTTDMGQPPTFVEQALATGLAFDADGAAQACMGVAAGDADGDGRLDLFVTNFYNESNTLYLQRARGSFQDATRAAGLREPSFAMLGFGTQFLDADLDGREDLVVTNGHIDDLTAVGQPYRMPPQFFRNQGGGGFVEVPASALGPFFEGQYLGRGLARLDWNRDGREDFAVSHIDSPAALVENRTDSAGHFVTVHLRGCQGSRDAIGAVVEVRVAGRRLVRQLTAGDGYHACNHRQLTFGLSDAERVDQLTVRWPGGTTQSWESLKADTEWLLREGTTQPIELRRTVEPLAAQSSSLISK